MCAWAKSWPQPLTISLHYVLLQYLQISCLHGFEVPASNGNHRIMFSRLGVWTGAERLAGLVENETKDASGQNNQRVGETCS